MVGTVLHIHVTDGTTVATGGLTSGAAGSDTLCLADGCYSISVGGGFYDSEITFDFGGLVGATAGTYDNLVSWCWFLYNPWMY